MMDFVHIWHDDIQVQRFIQQYSLPLPMASRSKLRTKKFYFKCFKSSFFPNHMIDLVHIWNDIRYWFKVLFIITPTHAYDLKVKVTDIL